jgi:hypothetical protein
VIKAVVEAGARAFNKPCGCQGRKKDIKRPFFLMAKSKTKMNRGNKICSAGIAWAKRTFDRYPSAYANMGCI